MWGQSAGAISVDVHNFAYPEDPIVTSFFAQSGSVFLNIGTKDVEQSNFTFVSAQLGDPSLVDNYVLYKDATGNFCFQ